MTLTQSRYIVMVEAVRLGSDGAACSVITQPFILKTINERRARTAAELWMRNNPHTFHGFGPWTLRTVYHFAEQETALEFLESRGF